MVEVLHHNLAARQPVAPPGMPLPALACQLRSSLVAVFPSLAYPNLHLPFSLPICLAVPVANLFPAVTLPCCSVAVLLSSKDAVVTSIAEQPPETKHLWPDYPYTQLTRPCCDCPPTVRAVSAGQQPGYP